MSSKSDLNAILSQTLFPSTQPTKSQLTQLKIIQAAIRLFASKGIEGTSYEEVAKTAAVSRPLVQHYFPAKDALFLAAVKYIRANLQALAVQAIQSEGSVSEQLCDYVDSTFDWIEQFPEHARVWLLFYHFSATNREYRQLNSELVLMGHKRISAMLSLEKRRSRLNARKTELTAKIIQTLITGALLTLLTEDLPKELESFRSEIKRQVLCLADLSVNPLTR